MPSQSGSLFSSCIFINWETINISAQLCYASSYYLFAADINDRETLIKNGRQKSTGRFVIQSLTH